MAISLRAAGTATAATAATTAINPSVPTGTTTGDLSVLTVWMKPYNTTITTPSGWTKIGEHTNGTTASGIDTGSTKVAVYVRESAPVGAIGNITFTNANSCGAVINSYQKAAGTSWNYASFTQGFDNTNAANYSATGDAGINVASGDWVCQSTAVNGDVGTLSAFAIGGMSGATLGTYTNRQSAATTTGQDTRGVVGDVPITAGSSNNAPTFTYTNASSGSGTTIWLRLREVTATPLTTNNAAHAQTASQPTITYWPNYDVAVNNAAHAQASGSPTLTQHHVLLTNNAAHVQAASSPTLVQHHKLTTNNSVHAHIGGSPTIAPKVTITVNNSAHVQYAPAVALTFPDGEGWRDSRTWRDLVTWQGKPPTQTSLTANNASHASASTSPSLTQHHVLAVNNSAHAHAANNVAVLFNGIYAKIWNGTSWQSSNSVASAPTFVSVESGFTSASQTTITVTKPSAAQAGDIVLVQILSSGATAVLTSPAEFTDVQTSTSNVDYRWLTSWRVIQSGDTSWDFTCASTVYMSYVAITLRGQGGTPIYDFDAVNLNGASVTTNVDIGATPCMLVTFTGCDLSAAMTWTIDSGTERIDETVGTEWLSQAAYTESVTSGTKTRVLTPSTGTQDIHAISIAVAGAAGSGGIKPWNGTSWKSGSKVWNGTSWVLL